MNPDRWNRLSSGQQAFIRSVSSRFIQAVFASEAVDGYDFSLKYRIESQDGNFVITNGSNVIGDISHQDKVVMEALMSDACANYGR